MAHGPMALANANPSVKTGFLGAYIYAIFMVLITLKTGARLLVYRHPGTHEKIAGSQPFLLDQKTASLGQNGRRGRRVRGERSDGDWVNHGHVCQ